MKIHKYPFEVKDDIEISMPRYAQILTVQTQNNTPCIWAMVDKEEPMQKRRFQVFATGQPITSPIMRGNYIGTFQLMDGQFVGHLFGF